MPLIVAVIYETNLPTVTIPRIAQMISLLVFIHIRAHEPRDVCVLSQIFVEFDGCHIGQVTDCVCSIRGRAMIGKDFFF